MLPQFSDKSPSGSNHMQWNDMIPGLEIFILEVYRQQLLLEKKDV